MPKPQCEEPDFELADCSQEPYFQVLDFLEGRKLGPAGRNLLEALGGFKPLTEAQEDLLQKVCIKLGHSEPEFIQAVLEEQNIMVQGLAKVDRQCSSSALDMT